MEIESCFSSWESFFWTIRSNMDHDVIVDTHHKIFFTHHPNNSYASSSPTSSPLTKCKVCSFFCPLLLLCIVMYPFSILIDFYFDFNFVEFSWVVGFCMCWLFCPNYVYTRSTPTNIRKHGVCKRKSNSLEKRIPQHVLTDNKKPIYDILLQF